MSHVRRIVTQWLEAESAFGMTEAPLSVPRAGVALTEPAPESVIENVPAPRPSERPMQPAPPTAPRTNFAGRPGPPANAFSPNAVIQPAAVLPARGAPVMARSPKVVVDIPAAPNGDIADLPVLSREQKESQLAALLQRAGDDLAPHFTKISTKLVFGEGDPDAPVMFIGEGPGIEEDRTGRPFVGKSGQLLDKQIQAMGYQRGEVYIANIVKLRAADFDAVESRVKDRPPTPEEVARQIPILYEQIAIIRPQAIVTLGAPAIKWLTGTTEGVMKIRGTWMDHRGIPVMPTYHPAFLLRAYTTENRKKVWDDLKKVMELLGKKVK